MCAQRLTVYQAPTRLLLALHVPSVRLQHVQAWTLLHAAWLLLLLLLPPLLLAVLLAVLLLGELLLLAWLLLTLLLLLLLLLTTQGTRPPVEARQGTCRL